MNFLDPRARVAQSVIGFIIVVGFFSTMYIPLLTGTRSVDDTLSATLSNMFILVVGYYFGSSSSNAKNADTIAALVTNPPITPPVKVDDTTPIHVQETSK